jgi:hypothetical protein
VYLSLFLRGSNPFIVIYSGILVSGSLECFPADDDAFDIQQGKSVASTSSILALFTLFRPFHTWDFSFLFWTLLHDI